MPRYGDEFAVKRVALKSGGHFQFHGLVTLRNEKGLANPNRDR